eukprot:39918-Hanusia_phi.AAC.1
MENIVLASRWRQRVRLLQAQAIAGSVRVSSWPRRRTWSLACARCSKLKEEEGEGGGLRGEGKLRKRVEKERGEERRGGEWARREERRGEERSGQGERRGGGQRKGEE